MTGGSTGGVGDTSFNDSNRSGGLGIGSSYDDSSAAQYGGRSTGALGADSSYNDSSLSGGRTGGLGGDSSYNDSSLSGGRTGGLGGDSYNDSSLSGGRTGGLSGDNSYNDSSLSGNRNNDSHRIGRGEGHESTGGYSEDVTRGNHGTHHDSGSGTSGGGMSPSCIILSECFC